MKITAILLLVATLHVSAKGWGQEKITISVTNAPLDQVFSSITSQSGVSFFYRPQYVKDKTVTINVTNADLKTVLDLCLKNQELSYEIVGKTVAVHPVKASSNSKENKTTEINDLPGPIDVTGRVTNEQGEPLSGANVVIRRTGTGTVTNANGQFSIKNISSDDILLVSYIGYSSISIKVTNKANLILVMHVAATKLDEAVIQAYGKTTDRLRTGNISRVSSDEIEKHPVMNPVRILQGLVPGTVITNSSGNSSSSVKVEIRGRNTIDPTMISEPLYIVDGVPMTILNLASDKVQSYVGGTILSQGTIQTGIPSGAGIGQSPFFGINPSDIESIEVLKDADATAIYGSRASNGVILITTKKGKAGKTRAELSCYTGFSQVPRYYSLLNTTEYVAMRKEALANDNRPINIQTAPDLVLWDTTRYTDWQKYIYGGTGKRTSAQMNISGGDARINFRASAGYDYDKDIVTEKGGNYRTSFSLHFNHKSLNQKLGFSWSSIYSISKIDAQNLPGSALLSPNAPPVFDNSGKLNFAGWGANGGFPFASLLQPYTSRTNFLNSNMIVTYEILKGLIISASFGYNNSQNEQTNTIPIVSQDPSLNPTGSVRLGRTIFHNVIIEPKLSYSSFINKGKLELLVGGTSQLNKTHGLLNEGVNYTTDLFINTINSAPNKSISEYQGEYKYSGFFGRINYNWLNKYIISLNGRRDGSSRFGPGRQFGNFGSIGGAWIFTEESWMKKLSLLSFGKIRSSYGITGSDNIPDYQFLSRWQFGGFAGTTGTYNSNIPLTPVGFSDSLLQWEVNKKLEVSVSLGFLNDRILLEASWYRNRCNNQLVAFPTPAYSGFNSVISNTPANVQNTGWEFVLNTKIFDNKDFKWTIKTSISTHRNKLLDYPNLSQSPYKNRFVIGKSLGIQRFLHYTGVDPQTGQYSFEDVNKDGSIILGDDDQYFVDLTPKFDGGFTTVFRYKNWELSCFFYFRKQYGNNILVSAGVPGIMRNQSVAALNHWKKSGDVSEIGKLTTLSTVDGNLYFNYSDARVSDASFIRLQNLSFAYNLPEVIKKKAGFGNFKIYIEGENIFFITSYKGIDPEVQNIGVMPFPRTISAGLSCNF